MSKFRQLILGDKKDDLKSNLRKYIFSGSGNDPIAVCEKAGDFTMVMSVFQNYERNVVSACTIKCVHTCTYMLVHNRLI